MSNRTRSPLNEQVDKRHVALNIVNERGLIDRHATYVAFERVLRVAFVWYEEHTRCELITLTHMRQYGCSCSGICVGPPHLNYAAAAAACDWSQILRDPVTS